MSSEDHEEYLKSDEWRRQREAALKRAGWQCQSPFCQWESLELHVHHLTYERLGCERPTDLMVLCSLCHRQVHGIRFLADGSEDKPRSLRVALSRLIEDRMRAQGYGPMLDRCVAEGRLKLDELYDPDLSFLPTKHYARQGVSRLTLDVDSGQFWFGPVDEKPQSTTEETGEQA